MRTLAIGDIHGCYRSLKRLEQLAQFTADDKIVTVGDHVDRGPDSRSVIEWLMDRIDDNVTALCGNHELMMLASRQSIDHTREWLACGGQTVLDSYGIDSPDRIPESHWRFLRTRLRSYHIAGEYFFVHANAYADLELDEQPDYMLYWESKSVREPHQSGRTMICGHTPQRSGVPLDLGHAICIDTAACRGGWLTCLDVESRYCWQANEDGDSRSFYLDLGPRR